jgi:hypothetical protein
MATCSGDQLLGSVVASIENRLPTTLHTSMHSPLFHEWLAAREQVDVPDATMVTQLISHAGAAGISHHDLHKAVSLEPETLNVLLSALIGVAQIAVVVVDGEKVYGAV